MTELFTRLARHRYAQALLDSPRVFAAFRFLLVGRQAATHALLRRYLDVRAGERVLDVCCGIGEFAEDVEAEYVGIDLNPRFVTTAIARNARSTGKRFIVMDALHMEFADKSFDCCIFINGLHHFSDEAGTYLLREIRRVTRRRVVIIDADGTPSGLLRRILLSADRGEWMRTSQALGGLVAKVLPVRRVERFDVGLYTELLYQCDLD